MVGLRKIPWGGLEEDGWRGVPDQVEDQQGGCCSIHREMRLTGRRRGEKGAKHGFSGYN